MKLRVAYTVHIGDDYRHAIRHMQGLTGLATRAEVADFFFAEGYTNGLTVLEDYMSDEGRRR